MFGIGGQEMVIIALLFLVIFGPGKIPQMARDFGSFVSQARRSMDEFKEELTASPKQESKKVERRNGHNESSGEEAEKKDRTEDLHDL